MTDISKVHMLNFGDDVVIDFNDYSKASFIYRKNREFKEKDFGRQIVLDYYSNTYDIVNARMYFFYYSKYKPHALIRQNFKIIRGKHHLEFNIPVNFKQLKSIQIDIIDYESNDDRYLFRIDNLFFTEKEKSVL